MTPRTRGHDPARLELNLTPLLDVVLQLVTFFMMLVHFGTRIEAAEQEVRLPVAPAALPGERPEQDRIVVSIGPTGALLVGGEQLEGEEADRWWAAQAAPRIAALGSSAEELATLVIVRADREAPYGAVRSTLASAQAAGFASFSLVVLQNEEAD